MNTNEEIAEELVSHYSREAVNKVIKANIHDPFSCGGLAALSSLSGSFHLASSIKPSLSYDEVQELIREAIKVVLDEIE